ncbi:conserved domain-containing protein [Promicromonospora umidemergens]|uniref:PRC and DUF2382 domain-containing protein n=1 Tax=Promicromonospora umidemergens TaxID=629679 RepID=A0ABP8XD26_9MICO|nr:PRC and DUF2382 domain-containing protein [Promicromonospora umidemergens]MCP2281785.1 conserved domain-containing protein [Promicromonospora umidemergens]
MITTQQVQELLEAGGTVVGSDGHKIGKVGTVYLDDTSGRPEWVTAKTGLFGRSETFIPLAQGNVRDQEIQVPYDQETVKGAPRLDDPEGHLTQDQEKELYRYYGLESSAQAGTVGHDVSGPNTDEAMTRSEEQLRVGTHRVESGKARLRKYVVTEDVTQTVPVSHEEVRVEREPVTDANRGRAMAGGDITEEEHEVTLHAERPTVDKETVPVERVRMDTDTVTEDAEISEQLRKEQIQAEGETGQPSRSHGNRPDRGTR